MAQPLELAGAYARTEKGNNDQYYGGGDIGYVNAAAACAFVPLAIRPGKTVGIVEGNKVVEYIWHPSDVSNTGLLKKTADVDLSGYLKNNGDTYKGNLEILTDGTDKRGLSWSANSDFASLYLRKSGENQTQFVIELGDDYPMGSEGLNDAFVFRKQIGQSGGDPYLNDTGYDMLTISGQKLKYNPDGGEGYDVLHSGMGGVLSDQNYTLLEKQKLAAFVQHFKGKYTTLSSLQAVPGTDGDYTLLDAGPGTDAVEYIFDVNDNKWVPSSNTGASSFGQLAGAPTDNAALAAALNAKQNTESGKGLSQENYTTAEKTKAGGVATGATANVAATDAETQITATIAEDNKHVTRLKLFNWWTWVKTQAATIAGNWTFNGIATFANNFILQGVSPALTWTTTGNNQTASWLRSPTLNAFTLNNNVYQPGAVGKSIQLNIDGRTSNYQYGSFSTNGMPAGLGTAGSAFSVCLWFRSTSTSTGMFVSFNPAATFNGGPTETFIALSNGIIFISGNGSTRTIGSGYNDGQWHYLCMTKAGTTNAFGLYVDGALLNSQATNMYGPGTTGTAYVGIYSPTLNISPFRGEIDGLLIYNYPLTSDEVLTNYGLNGVGTASPVNQSSLSANWPFDEGTGSTAASVNGGTRNITFVNNPTWNAAGKISNTGSTVLANGFSHQDGQLNGEKGLSVVGDISGGVLLRGVAVRSAINNKNSFSGGRNNKWRLDPNYIFDPDASGNVSNYGNMLIGLGDASSSQLQFLPQSTPVIASANTLGGHWWDGTRLNTVNSITATAQYAYLSDVPKMLNYTASGNGSSTVITFAHGLTGITVNTPFDIDPHSVAAANPAYKTIDDTNISVYYNAAPPSGTSNLLYTLTIKP